MDPAGFGVPVVFLGAIRIARLCVVERATPAVNLFETIPPRWVADRDLVARASTLWGSLNRPFQHLVNTVFWEGRRFQRFLVGPSSLNGHHCELNGNFRHAVEVPELCVNLAITMTHVSHSVLVAAAKAFLRCADAGSDKLERMTEGYCLDYFRDTEAIEARRNVLARWRRAPAREGRTPV